MKDTTGTPMASSLISERPLLISPSLAATIGLEEACMLSILSDFAAYRALINADGRQWLEVDESWVNRLMPFWTEYDIQRISKNLKDKGIIQLASAPYTQSRQLIVTFEGAATNNQPQGGPTQIGLPQGGLPQGGLPQGGLPQGGLPQGGLPQGSLQEPAPQQAGANRISPNWQPDAELLKRIAEHNIPEYFIYQQLPEFITYWRERGEIHHSWGAKFLKDVLHKWRENETQIARQKREQQRDRDEEFLKRDQETAMHSQWRPSRDALEVLVKHAGISLAFVEDAIPEFVVYWQERGELGRTWNSKFIQHVKRQWMRYNSALEHDTEPRRLPDNWQPSKDVYDVLKLANIDLNFAQQQLPEFILFWRDSNQIHASWNTKFLQHVKYHWAKQHALTSYQSQQVNQHAGQQLPHPSGRTKDRSLADQLNDRSWAS